MQKTLTAILVAGLILILTNCNKNPDIDIERFEFTDEQVSVQDNSTTITGSYSFSGNIKGITVLVAENESLTQTSSYAATVDLKDKTFSATLDDLKPATTYFYYLSVDFGFDNPYRTEAKTFRTTSTIGHKPTIVILETTELDCTTYIIKCEVVSDGGLEVTERGICWSTSDNPSLNDETAQHNTGGTGQYSIRLDDLSTDTEYHVRAYAKNSLGISYSDTKQFTTCIETFPPSVTSVKITDITYNSAICHGEIVSDGGLPLKECGVCWSLKPAPTINEHFIVAEGTAIGPYTVVIEDLTPETTYYVRCYAINDNGTSYGEELSFSTEQLPPIIIQPPTVITEPITNITTFSAKLTGTVTDDGGAPVKERGFCFSRDSTFFLTNSNIICGTGIGEFTITIENLTPGTTYYVKTYAINESDYTGYGDIKRFTTRILNKDF